MCIPVGARLYLAVFIAVLVQLPQATQAQPAAVEGSVLQRFELAAQEYARLRRIVNAHLAPLDVTSDPEEILKFSDALSAGMRAARPAARQGDLFTPVVSAIVRARIASALNARGIDADELRAEMEEGAATAAPMGVNGPYNWWAPATMAACVIDVLPALPAALQYRFVGDDLFLIDVDAGLIVDILPDALPDDDRRSPRQAADGGAL
jgi:hypothetical protein